MNIPSVAKLLHETAQDRRLFEAVATRRDWWDQYAGSGEGVPR